MNTDKVGPIEHFDIGGAQRPLYTIKFDDHGVCISPRTRDHLLDALAGHSDILLFSHGWNNSWEDAKRSYETFITQSHALARARNAPLPADYAPLFVGVFWPSISLLLPWEQAPAIASTALSDVEMRAVAALIAPEHKKRFEALVSKTGPLDLKEALEFAAIFAQTLASKDDVTLKDEALTASDLLSIWRAAPPPDKLASGTGLDRPEVGTVDDTVSDSTAQAAGFFDYLDPRWLARLATVRIMKDRAGVVGGNGVADLIAALAKHSNARIHAIGHSYGAKVLLTAALHARLSQGRQIESMLLLQPAISYLCFAANTGAGHAGGFRPTRNKIRRPIFSTFSSQDFALTRVYHYAVRRASDLGEIQAAADAVPSRYAALGGYGPAAATNGETRTLTMPAPGTAYPQFGAAPRVIGLDGSGPIDGHGGIFNEHAYWALLNQLV